jgi:hypothetical protein
MTHGPVTPAKQSPGIGIMQVYRVFITKIEFYHAQGIVISFSLF